MDHKRLMTMSGAARVYDIPKQTLHSAIGRGELTPHKLGCGTEVYDSKDVERWIGKGPERARAPLH